MALKCAVSHEPLTQPTRLSGCEHRAKCNWDSLRLMSRSQRCPIHGCKAVARGTLKARERELVRDEALGAALRAIPPRVQDVWIHSHHAVEPLGSKWRAVGRAKPTKGKSLTNEALARALLKKREFTQAECDAFELRDLASDSFIKAGSQYFEPAAGCPPELYYDASFAAAVPPAVRSVVAPAVLPAVPPSVPPTRHTSRTEGRRDLVSKKRRRESA